MMKIKIYLLCIVSICCSTVTAQDIKWEKSFGGKYADNLTDVIPTADFGFIIAGSSVSAKGGNKTINNNGDFDYWIWKMDEKGDPEWQRSYGGPGTDMLQSIKNTKDGGFILAGTSNSSNLSLNKSIKNDKTDPSRGGNDIWVIKLDASGGIDWQKTIGGTGEEKISNIVQTKDGGYIIGGSSSSEMSPKQEISDKKSIGEKTDDSFGNIDYWVVKIDNKGKIEWQKTLGGIYFDELRSIEQTYDDGFIVGGYSNSPKSGNKTEDNIGVGDYWVLKLDSKGEIVWQKTIGGNYDDQLFVLHQTYDKGIILGGNSNSGANFSKSKANRNGIDFWILKLDEGGDVLWQETYDIGSLDVLTSIVENKDHTLLLGGYAQSEVERSNKREIEGINDYVAIKITEKGEEIWRKSLGSNGEDILRKVIETRDGGYLFAGTSNPTKSNLNLLQSNKLQHKSPNGLNNGSVNNPISNGTSGANDLKEAANNSLKENTKKFENGVSDAVGLDKDSPIKFGLNSPLGNSTSSNGNSSDEQNTEENGTNNSQIPPSRDKKRNYGGNDFWVVKLKDSSKPKVERLTIEAFPNPTETYTNVIIGYDYIGGTATVADMAGRLLQQFKITGRTVPVDLKNYPVGIYVINIKTNVQSDGVKVMKGMTKN